MITLSKKDPAEVIPVTFDFSRLVSAIDSVITVEITVHDGIDANSSTMLLGSAVVDGSELTQMVRNGLDSVVYSIKAEISKGDEKYKLSALLPVQADQL